jgi:hypothetical protein
MSPILSMLALCTTEQEWLTSPGAQQAHDVVDLSGREQHRAAGSHLPHA